MAPRMLHGDSESTGSRPGFRRQIDPDFLGLLTDAYIRKPPEIAKGDKEAQRRGDWED